MIAGIWMINFMVIVWSSAFHLPEAITGNIPKNYEDITKVNLVAAYYKKWSDWSQWSQCTRSCNGGIESRTRTCLKFAYTGFDNHVNNNKFRKEILNETECEGESKQSRLCNEIICSGDVKDFRLLQCQYFNKKLFAGSFYSWKPYYNATNPCALNCQPSHHKFYVTLKNKVIDGTPCDSPADENRKSVCVDAKCQVVGCDGIIGGKRYDVCGICGGDNSTCRLVVGIRAMRYLIPGYNYITEIPQYAYNFTVSEVRLKRTTNLFAFYRVCPIQQVVAVSVLCTEKNKALRFKNGTFLFNGVFLTTSFGIFSAAGTEFTYVEENDFTGSILSTPGPILYPIELWLFYRQKNLGIKYEYKISVQKRSIKSKSENNYVKKIFKTSTHRHHISNIRYNNEKYNSVDFNTVSTTSAEHDQIKLLNENHTKNFTWKVTAFSECSRTCGGGVQKPIYSCIDQNKYVQIVNEKYCEGMGKPEAHLVQCNTVKCSSIPNYTSSFSWQVTDWSQCSVSCGEGIETRDIVCKQKLSSMLTITVPLEMCRTIPLPNLPRERLCFKQLCNNNSISSEIYWGMKPRNLKFKVGSNGNDTDTADQLEYSLADSVPRILNQETLKSLINHKNYEQYHWFSGLWSTCTEDCGWGKQHRIVVCILYEINRKRIKIVSENNCKNDEKPLMHQSCYRKSCGSQWFVSSWKNQLCDFGIETRDLLCLKENSELSFNCEQENVPITSRLCNISNY